MRCNQIKSALIGAGKMGSLHARIHNDMAGCKLVAVVDSDINRARNLASKYHCMAYQDFRKILGKVDAVIIASPTMTHYSIAREFLIRKIPVLVEKPLAHSIVQGKALVELAAHYDTILAVGHSERCNPVIQALKRYKIRPRFIECQRIHPYPFRSEDTGVILDVMIHDIDIVLSLIESPVKQVDAIGASIINRNEDICYASIHFENGCIANLTASRIALAVSRKLQIYSSDAYICINYSKKKGIIIQSKRNLELSAWRRKQGAFTDHDAGRYGWKSLLDVENIEIEDHEPLRLQMQSFLKSIRNRKARPEVTGEEGLAALDCASRIQQSLRRQNLSSEII